MHIFIAFTWSVKQGSIKGCLIITQINCLETQKNFFRPNPAMFTFKPSKLNWRNLYESIFLNTNPGQKCSYIGIYPSLVICNCRSNVQSRSFKFQKNYPSIWKITFIHWKFLYRYNWNSMTKSSKSPSVQVTEKELQPIVTHLGHCIKCF